MFWENFMGEDKQYIRTQKETLDRFAILAIEPGERFLYSNLGIGLLHYTIEQVARKPYDTYMHDEVFVPLNFDATLQIVINSFVLA